MKNLKKLISVIIAVIMIVGSFATVSAADYADVESTNSYYKAIQVLSGLGIAKGDEAGNFNPTADVKRSEMVTFICRAMGEEDIANGAAGANFTDVAANHWAAGYIAWGVNRGIINGMGDGTFAPDAPVKYQDAVVMIMRALGYDRIAQRAENGGYPTGYLKVASQRGVLDGAGYDSTKAATREIIAQLINNALTAPIVEVSQYGLNPEDDRYIIHDENAVGGLKCLLTTTNKIYRVRATVTDSFLVNPDLIKEDGNKVEITIEKGIDYDNDVITAAMDGALIDSVYAGSSELNKAAVGEVVELYIAEDEDLNDWVALAAVGSKSTVTTTVENVVSVLVDENDAETYILKYKANASDSIKKAKEIDIADDAEVYINGKVTETAVSALNGMIDDIASWTLVRPKSESKIKGVFITVYNYKVVKEVSVAKERVYFTDGTSLKLDPEARDNEKFFYNIYNAEGKAITLEDVKADDVLNILVPGNDASISAANSLIIYVTSNTVEGSVSEVVSEEDGIYVIEGEEYVSAEELKINEAGKFFISIDGKVVDVDTSVEISKNFALVSYADDATKMSKTTYELDLLTKDGKIETYSLASKVRIYEWGIVTPAVEDNEETEEDETAAAVYGVVNGSYSATNGLAGKFAAIEALCTVAESYAANSASARLITYKLNANGEISEIRMPAVVAYELNDETITNGKLDAEFAEYANLDASNATLLIVPSDAFLAADSSSKRAISEEKIEVVSFADIAVEEYTATIYQTDKEAEDDVFTFAIGTTPIANEWINAPLAVVTKVTSTLVDGDTVEKITFVESGAVKSLTVEYGSDVEATLAKGDVFQYAVNADGEIDAIQLVVDFDASNIALTSAVENIGYKDDKYAFAIGYLSASKGGAFKLADDFADDDDIANFDSANIETIKFVEDDAYTYAKVDILGIASNDKNAITAIELADIEASKDAKEVVIVLVKLDENGKAADVVVFEDVENGLVDKANVDFTFENTVVPAE